MERIDREKEQKELEKEMAQLQELRRSNLHLTEADDSTLTPEQRELKEFLLGSVNEVSRRKQALAKQIEKLNKRAKNMQIFSTPTWKNKKTSSTNAYWRGLQNGKARI